MEGASIVGVIVVELSLVVLFALGPEFIQYGLSSPDVSPSLVPLSSVVIYSVLQVMWVAISLCRFVMPLVGLILLLWV